jgi:hypothetical protein
MQDDQVIAMPEIIEETQQEQGAEQEAPQQQAQATEQPKETEQARNFRQLKEARERAERERDEAIRIIREMQSRQQQPQPAPVEEDDLALGAEDVAEGKHVKKVYNEVRELKKQLKQYQQQSSETVAETRLKATYPDADRVLSADNINAFKDKYPEMANTIYNSTGDMYSKLVSAYTMIKQLGVHHEDLYEADRNLAQKNAAKPRPLTSISPQQGDTPLSKANAFANGLTPELQKQLIEEMNKARQGY